MYLILFGASATARRDIRVPTEQMGIDVIVEKLTMGEDCMKTIANSNHSSIEAFTLLLPPFPVVNEVCGCNMTTKLPPPLATTTFFYENHIARAISKRLSGGGRL